MMAKVRSAAALAFVCGFIAAPVVAQESGTFDGSWSAAAPVGQPPAGSSTTPGDGGGMPSPRGGGMGGHGGMGGGGGGMGGGGMGGGGMGGGGHGGHHHGGGPQGAHVTGANDTEQNDPGLRRVFAQHLTITKLTHPDRVRFDDGEHPIELGIDGMNVSGPAVGGTVALSAASPDLVVDTVTTSGYTVKERYTLADDGTHLELHATIKKPGASDAREITRVFDRGEAKPAGTTPAG